MKCIHAWVMAVSAVALFTASAPSVGQRGGSASATAAAVRLAQAFLNSLDADQRPKASYPYQSDKKSTWHNLPPPMAPRAGITLRELTPEQRNAAMTCRHRGC